MKNWALWLCSVVVAAVLLVGATGVWACGVYRQINVTPTMGFSGSTVTVTGNGINSGAAEIHWQSATGQLLATVSGPSFQVSVTIPPSRPNYYLMVLTQGNLTTTTSFQVVPVPAAAPAAVVGGDYGLYVKPDGQNFQGLGGALLAAPAVVSVPGSSGATPLYIGVGTDRRLYVRKPNLDWLDLATDLPVGCYDSPAAAVTPAGAGTNILTVACLGGDGALYSTQTTVASGPTFPPRITTPFHSLGGRLLAGPAVAPVNGTLTYFAEGLDHSMYTTTGDGIFTPLPGACIGHPAVTSNASDAYFVCHGLDGAVYYSKNAGGAGWGPFRSAGGQVLDGLGAALTAGGVAVFAEGVNGELFYTVLSLDASSASPWFSDGGGINFGAAAG